MFKFYLDMFNIILVNAIKKEIKLERPQQNSMDRGAWQATVELQRASDTTQWLAN